MNLLNKWRKREIGQDKAMVKHQRGRTASGECGQQIQKTFDRVWSDFDHDPWSALAALPQQLSGTRDWPAVDISEDEKAVTLRVDVPGLDEKDLDVQVTGNLLTIRGSREDEWSDKKQGMYRRERVSGSFVRRIALPSYVDTNTLEAKYAKGTLEVTGLKIAGQGPRRVSVTEG